ncbi:hypothetical protein AB0L25_29000 [Spirillospora sp. NPDC052242]
MQVQQARQAPQGKQAQQGKKIKLEIKRLEKVETTGLREGG